MPKLSTPFQYEDSLDELNMVRLLNLVDEVKRIIDIPVLDVNPVDEKGFAAGKLLRCDNNGALLSKNADGFKYCETQSFEIDSPAYFVPCEFAQEVQGVLLDVTDSENIVSFTWLSPATFGNLQYFNILGRTWVNIKGDVLLIKVSGAPPYYHYFTVYGFYN
ncbi:hypothetical protein ES703_62775 [subsurface metagenome]